MLSWESYLIRSPKDGKHALKKEHEGRRKLPRKFGLYGNDLRFGTNYRRALYRAQDAIKQQAEAVTSHGILMKALGGQQGQGHHKSIIEKRAAGEHGERNGPTQTIRHSLPALPSKIISEYIKRLREGHDIAMGRVRWLEGSTTRVYTRI